MTYVAIGASESVGIGADDPAAEGWTQVFFRIALPRAAVFVNLGIPGATVEEAIQEELPDAVGAGPDVVTVWLNVNDLIRGVPADTYQGELEALLGQLGATGATVLVANTPPLDHLPAYVACAPFAPGPDGGCDTAVEVPAALLNGWVSDYNLAIERAASREGAIVVDLFELAMQARADGTEQNLVSDDGFHPSTEGHRAVAEAFAAAFARAGS